MTAPAPIDPNAPPGQALAGPIVPPPVAPPANTPPAAPVVPPTNGGGTTTPPATTPAPAPGDKPSEYADWMKDPAQVAKVVAELREENAKNRKGKETAAEEAARKAQEEMTEKFAVMLGLKPGPDAGLDPAAVQAKYEADLTAAKGFGHQKAVELSVYKLAAAAGADPLALLDSAGFLSSVAKVDPDDGEAITEAIKAAVEKNKRLAAAPVEPAPTPGASAADFSGGPRDTPDIDAQIEAAHKAGNHALVISLKRQKARTPA